MNLTFDYYHNLQETELYLCNPDGRELFPLVGYDRTLTLRFNDLSELKFNCYATTTSSDGTVVAIDAYDYVQTRRLVFVTGIGWFVIKNVTEQDNGIVKYKEVSCESLQATFKDRGFYCEEKVYYFFNPSDPYDANYDPDNEASIPSVMGQLYQQLGIKQSLSQGLSDPVTPYSDWTITYINSALTGKGRNFKESTSYGYEWMVKDVEEAFEVVILFDFYYKTIHVMLPSEVTSMSSVIYTFSNFMKDVEIEEDAENIVTVMSCNGDNCDIRAVNPTGTNYICDFSYYMDSAGKWMSSSLKTKINQWIAAVNAAKSNYENKVLQLRTAYANLASVNSSAQEISKIYTDLAAAVARKSVAISENSASTLYGIVWAETVNIGERSADPTSSVYSTDLAASKQITAYKDMPTFNENTRTWSCSGASHTGTLNECYAYVDGNNNQYLYFIDSSNNTSYCKLEGKATINPTTYATEYSCKGFKRYIDLNIANVWTSRYDSKRQALQSSKASYEATIASLQSQLESISSSLNILNYFSSSPTLLKELMCYWIEGEYTNDNIAVLEDTTQAEAIDLANELRDSGAIELAKVCQPKLQFSLSSVDCTKQYEFRDQMAALELGKIITVEKEEGLWYYPALLEIEYDLDHTDTFSLKFANALRLDDWGYTYGDLISSASSTSRQVAANWQNMMAYSKDREVLSSLIKEPLSSTLRAAFANAVNQEFTIDETGILGRKFANSSNNSFVNEQMRIINNVILFTDDNWDTAKTALGKIYYTDSNNNLVTAYGLIGETIIGSLIMSEKMKIVNSDNTITLDSQGITIRKTVDGTTTETFRATPQGDLTIRGNIAGGSININSNFLVDSSGNVTIKRGSININNNFIVDSSGNVELNGNITWGTGASPTQILYATTALTAPTSGTSWSSYPATGTGWHRTYTSGDKYGTYTYDGGASWTTAFQINGETVNVMYLYYRSSSSTAPSTPSYTGGTLPTGWKLVPQTLSASNPYNYVSQCTVTNGVYGSWSSPALWATFSVDGDDGDTIKVAYLFYRSSSSSAPSAPSYTGDALPSGWSETPLALTSTYKYVYISECTVTNGTYGTWSTPTLWAKYGAVIQVKYLYYRNTTSTAPSAPSYSGGTLPTGWSDTPYSVSNTYQYVFVSQCTITDGSYGTWSTPTLWAKYGKNGTDGNDGNDGDTIYTVFMYYRKDSSSAPSTPSYSGSGSIPSGWSFTPYSVSTSYHYVFVSQCTITNGVWGTWSAPTCWAKYGDNGSDASVTDINVFNALTSNGTMYGCFTAQNSKLYINAAYIKSGQVDADLVLAGEVSASNIVATGGSIGGLTITGKLYFGGDSTYYISANYNDQNYYLFLPGLKIDVASGAVFSGTLSAATGSFSGDISAATGTFSGGISGELKDGIKVGTNGSCTLNSYNSGHGNTGFTLAYDSGTYLRMGQQSQGNEVWLYSSRYLTLQGGTSNSGEILLRSPYIVIGNQNSTDTTTEGRLYGNWYLNGGTTAVTSDANLKNTIADLSDAYSSMFDHLRPVTFKYNNGTSDRLHIGFIAQEVYSAMEEAQLPSQAFGGYVRHVEEDESIVYYLRYEEFIALNTREIQKLKARVARLEGLLGGSENE